jgi:hypothetical protein
MMGVGWCLDDGHMMCWLGFVLVMAIEIPLCFPMVARDKTNILSWNELKAVQMLPGLLFKCNELFVVISLWVSSCQPGGDICICTRYYQGFSLD